MISYLMTGGDDFHMIIFLRNNQEDTLPRGWICWRTMDWIYGWIWGVKSWYEEHSLDMRNIVWVGDISSLGVWISAWNIYSFSLWSDIESFNLILCLIFLINGKLPTGWKIVLRNYYVLLMSKMITKKMIHISDIW